MNLSIRVRLTLVYSVLIFTVGVLVLAGCFFLVKANLNATFSDQVSPREIQQSVQCAGQGCYPFQPGSKEYRIADEQGLVVASQFKDRSLRNLTTWGLGAVAVLGVIACALGWLMSGWALRPIRKVTDSARRVAQSQDLAGRISYRGGRDELRDLAETCDVVFARLALVFDGQRRFVANAAHELRTPLTINRTMVDVAIRRPDASDDVKRLGESLLVVNARHELLVERLLALADSERRVVARRPFDLRDVVENVLDHAEQEAGERGVTVHRLLDGAPAAGDAVLLERLAQNLVENAIRHNEEKGGQVWVTTRARNGGAELTVANTGPMVAVYEIEAIFEPFRRLNGDRLTSYQGSGLGLSIVQAIATAHDGSVTAVPRTDGGLTITVELPGQDAESGVSGAVR
ncbi:sensor histidine kinase [Spirillospora sp. CA-294931]|uniref:sensor histidine kinase n=1 Tax=Spirillospora sp. CA-294931 TaxID=3240042 RepID=UPI003D8EBE7E